MNDKIREIRQQIADLNEQRRDKEKELNIAICEHYGLVANKTIIVLENDGNPKRAIFRKIEAAHFEPPWLRVSYQKADGKFSNAERILYRSNGKWTVEP